ncbi:hypothetical protein TPHA_0H01920 [Tetrapisispora phaffii CBS 4417]|uniref:RNA polymerase II assembly factor Rtp1 C-terminal domain-containing protein n=1 Tax=Tetrapisispora phaffii (strain ATCC 24235 / CBS 4417 / NBRC 1672 / NRRL Y-8282 / UCD 70-5) TaxID=1071381 RepID=G8BWE6_TETPH|nr:hypothetical protein TPHA_0H01920 [Tetrapisispora phaffii CBS 4417]CCE64397.1 hypothetical protein TPHA_0H01920 [Tetrapisispora phaffii CBS 4417]
METEKKVNIKEVLLKEPEFVRGSDLDLFFEKLNDELIAKLKAANKNQDLPNIYQLLGFHNNEEFVTKIIDYFTQLHQITLSTQKQLSEEGKDILPISLHDIKFVDELIKLVIVHGIDANLPQTVRIPTEQKQLNAYKESNITNSIPKDTVPNFKVLETVIRSFYTIFKPGSSSSIAKDDYLRKVLLNGPLYSNVYIGLVFLHLQNNSFASLDLLNEFEKLQETYSLFVIYTLYIQTIKEHSLKAFFLNKLALLPLERSNGVISLVDFLLGVRDDDQIKMENLNRVSQTLLSKPSKLSNTEYLTKLFPQIIEALQSTNRPILITSMNQVILDFFNKNKLIVKDFLLKPVLGVFFNDPVKEHSVKELNDTINVLVSLSKTTSIELAHFITNYKENHQFYLNLWIYALFLKNSHIKKPLRYDNNGLKDSSYYEIILSLIKSYLNITGDFGALNTIYLNLANYQHADWKYQIDLETNLAYIVVDKQQDVKEDLRITTESDTDKLTKVTKVFQEMDDGIDLFIEFLKLLNIDDVTTNTFLNRLSSWIRTSKNDIYTENKTNTDTNLINNENSIFILQDLKFLEKVNDNFKSDFVKKPGAILNVVDELLDYISTAKDEGTDLTNIPNREIATGGDSDDDSEDESDGENQEDLLKDVSNDNTSSTFNILIDLLLTVLDNTNVMVLLKYKDTLINIKSKLAKDETKSERLGKISNQIDGILKSKPTGNSNNKLIDSIKYDEDNEKLDNIMINLSDPLVPIEVHGLHELCKLIQTGTEVITLSKVVDLQFQFLRNSDPFLYLNVIKNLNLLLRLNKEKTLPLILDRYNNIKKTKLDDILKIGEVLINFIQELNELFVGKIANMIIESCIHKIRRHDTLDTRIRMSAMSILGVCLQVNAIGISDKIPDILDCAFKILQLETTEKNSFLMRRSSIHIIHDLIYNSGFQLFPEQFSPEKTRTLLEYVKSNDNDGLVCETTRQLLEIIVTDQ